MAYQSAAEALVGLVSGEEIGTGRGPWRLKMTESPLTMRNGIDYCYVEVTFANGATYGIPGYGEEARELRKQALVLKEKGERSIILPIAV